jgi:outer membrane protein assembly factor BamB
MMTARGTAAHRIGRGSGGDGESDVGLVGAEPPPLADEQSRVPRILTRRRLLVSGGVAATAFALTSSLRTPTQSVDALYVDAASQPVFHSRPDLQIPGLNVAAGSQAATSGLLMLAPYGAKGKQAGPLILDANGDLIWQQPLVQPLVGTDLRVQVYKGRPALTWFEGRVEHGHGVGSYVIADADYTPLARVTAGNGHHGDLHEFLLTDRGTALLTTYRIVTRDLRSVGGPASGKIQDAMFQEIDLATGNVLLEWHSLDHIALEESFYSLRNNWDYVHLNSIAVDRDENLIVSSRNTHTLFKIDRATGEVIWRLGGKRSDFGLTREATFAWQHDARRQPDGTITLFDNGYHLSRGIVLSVDDTHRRVSLKRAYTHPAHFWSASQGNVQVMENGNVLVGWGAEPYISEFTADGALVFDGRLGTNYFTYRAYQIPWSGEGIATPAIVAERASTHTNVYASWNGDTRVTRWTALAGNSPTQLGPIRSVARAGFETMLQIPASFTHVSVRGSDGAGNALGTSHVAVII